MPTQTLKEYLDSQGIHYECILHEPAFTAQEVAQSAHIPGREMAKTVIVKKHGRWVMAVLPANRKVVLQDLRDVTGEDDIRLATEEEFRRLFPDCQVGAMPPFGNLYNMEVYLSPALTESGQITFNAGTHTEVIRMAFDDYERLVHPKILMFTT